MNLDDFQRSALRTVNPALDDRDRLLDASAGLAEEAAEVLGLVRKQVFQRRKVESARLVEELGDVLWCLAVTADSLGIPLSKVAEENQAKLAQRHPDGFRSESERLKAGAKSGGAKPRK
jgi:NTP pyrophosphatase (non-canonical NTP hydrolase)